MKKFGKYFVLLAVAILSSIAFTACGDDDDDNDVSDSKIVGTWKHEYSKSVYKENGKVVEEYEDTWNTYKMTWEFNSTGTLFMNEEGDKEWYNYTYSGKKLTVFDHEGYTEYTVKKLTGNTLIIEGNVKYVEDGISCEDYVYAEFSRLK